MVKIETEVYWTQEVLRYFVIEPQYMKCKKYKIIYYNTCSIEFISLYATMSKWPRIFNNEKQWKIFPETKKLR